MISIISKSFWNLIIFSESKDKNITIEIKMLKNKDVGWKYGELIHVQKSSI